jgi:RNA polymerase sigma factor (sigma-70 family)
MEPRLRAHTGELAGQTTAPSLTEPHRAEIARITVENQEPLFKYIRHRLEDHSLACDILQDVLRTACEKWHLRNPERPALPWLRRIAYNKISDHFRREESKKRGGRDDDVLVINLKPNGEPEVDGQPHICISPSLESCQEVFCNERDQIVARAIKTLSPDDQEVIRQRYWEHIPVSEIATFLDMSVSAVTSMLHRARERLRLILRDMGISDTSSEVNRHVKGDTM